MSLRDQRNRFVAFSFAAADLLVEVDGEGRIIYALGAGSTLFGRSCEDLIGAPLLEFFASAEHDFVRHLVLEAEAGQRFGPLVLPLAPGLPAHGLILGGCRLPDDPSRIYLALSEASFTSTSQHLARRQDAETGLLEREAFQEIARETLVTAKALRQDVRLTLVGLSEAKAFERRIGEVQTRQFHAHLGQILRGKAINNAAGRLAGERFGIVHDAALDAGAIEAQIGTLAQQIDPSGTGIDVIRSTLEIEETLSDEDAGRALVYTISRFARGEAPERMPVSLAEALRLVMADAITRIQQYRMLVNERRLKLVCQPIVALPSRLPHHFELLLRFAGEYSPYEVVTFAEEVGLITDVDFAVCEIAAEFLGRSAQARPFTLAVNLSGRSLTSSPFVARLLHLLSANRSLSGRLMFEITESARIVDLEAVNRVIAGLRKLGHEVCLDDFGAGAASFQYLSALDVDFVKIDGKYVREAGENRRKALMLKSIAALCTDLGIRTVAEMVETADQARLMEQLGLGFAQGHYFGRPVPLSDLTDLAVINAPDSLRVRR